ncbi:MAG: sigma-70 family RNA polymerase sigma factor [Planctomycetota bacterium]
MTDDTFRSLLQQAQAGDQDALKRLIERYESKIRIVVRSRLGPLLRPYLDSVDVIQSVHRSMMSGLAQGKFDIESPQNLVALATTMVRAKISNQWRRHKRQIRDCLSDTDRPVKVSGDPLDQLIYNDEMQRLLEELPEVDCQVIRLRSEGLSTAEAARKLGIPANVVRVRLSRIRKRLLAKEADVDNKQLHSS